MKKAIPIFLLIIFMLPGAAGAYFVEDILLDQKAIQIQSVKAMKTYLTTLKYALIKEKQMNQVSSDLQHLILSNTKECMSRILKMEQQADMTSDTALEEFRELFLLNSDIINEILSWNEKKINAIQENQLDNISDTEAFFSSPEWKQPQELISLSLYLISWNNYYLSLLYYEDKDHQIRHKLLESAVGGFSRVMIDFADGSRLIRSRFGRALCHKEMKKINSALDDLNTVISGLKHENPLYVRCAYEKTLVTYLSGNYEEAERQIKTFLNKSIKNPAFQTLENRYKKLHVQIIKALVAKEKKDTGRIAVNSFRYALDELMALSKSGDESLVAELYQFIKEYAADMNIFSATELGPVGNMALADWHFTRERYNNAIKHYEPVITSSHSMVTKHRDMIFFRLGFAYCKENKWAQAIPSFKTLFEQFPASPLIDKASCLQYIATANNYKENPHEESYRQYIESIIIYLKSCPDPVDRSEAHFQLGKYYQANGNHHDSIREFHLVKNDTPNYLEAKYYILNSDINRLESMHKNNLNRSQEALTLYDITLNELEKYKSLVQKQIQDKSNNELEVQTIILLARLFAIGPEETRKKTIQVLDNFEIKFPMFPQYFLLIKDLRLNYFQPMQMVDKSKKELRPLLGKDNLDENRWAFLNKWANIFYKTSKKSRDTERTQQAGQQAELALMIYNNLSEFTLKQSSYKKFYDSIQFRIAELFQDENQPGNAEKIYQEILKNNPSSADAVYNIGLINEKKGDWESALAAWRKLNTDLDATSYYWFESRYKTAKALKHLGKTDEASVIINMTQVLHPDMGDEKLKEKFILLQNELTNKTE